MRAAAPVFLASVFPSVLLRYLPYVLALAVTAAAQTPLALVPVADAGVKVSGSMEVTNGNAVLRSSGTITAGDRTANILLPGRGELHLCSTTTVHLAEDRSTLSPAGPSNGTPALEASAGPAVAPALLIGLDRGALEANYVTGKYSDVLMTPDFRILISGPGQADLRIRVSPQGDTCVENRGDKAPYVSVSSQIDGGVYRVQSNQRVLFEHGSLREVVDHETEPCGCPPPVVPAIAASEAASSPAAPGTAFPLAQSEGLAPAAKPAPSITGVTHTEVTVPLAYDGSAPAALNGPAPASGNGAASAALGLPPASLPASAPAAPPPPSPPPGNVFRRIGHFFSRLFGK